MHLEYPALTTTGKLKSKRKYRNADAAKKAREANEEWKQLKKRWDVGGKKRDTFVPLKVKPLTHRSMSEIPSVNGGVDTANAPKKEIPQYTGNNLVGITILHKSCLQPVFNKQEAVDAANMRR